MECFGQQRERLVGHIWMTAEAVGGIYWIDNWGRLAEYIGGQRARLAERIWADLND